VTTQRVLFLCTHNSARSQMAEGFLRAMARDRFEVQSAGTEKTAVHPLAIRTMAERGIDISGHTSKVYDGQRLHWSFEDPSRAGGNEETRLAALRRVRDQVEAKLTRWLATLSGR